MLGELICIASFTFPPDSESNWKITSLPVGEDQKNGFIAVSMYASVLCSSGPVRLSTWRGRVTLPVRSSMTNWSISKLVGLACLKNSRHCMRMQNRSNCFECSMDL